MYVLASLYALRQHIGLDAADTSEDGRLLDALIAASATIERHTRRTFQPRVESIRHDVDPSDGQHCVLKEDLLEVQSVVNGDGQTINLADVTLVDSYLLRLGNGAAFTFEDSPEDAITIKGIWGYHSRWSQAWVNSEDSIQDASLPSSVTTITVADANAGLQPRFQVGHLLRISDEYMRVTAVDTVANTLTVLRGLYGTIAATRGNGTPIYIYQVPADVHQLVLRWALWLYREPDNFAKSVPPVLMQTLADLRRVSVRG